MIDSYEKYRQVAKYAGGHFEEQFLELIDRLEATEKERDDLRAKIKSMEQQKPAAWVRGRDDHRRRKLSFEKPVNSSPDKFHWSPLYALPGAQAQPAPSVPNLDMDALERQSDELKEEVGKLRDALVLIADQYEPKCDLLIPSIARSALCATGSYGQKESPESWPTEAMVTAFAELFNVRDQKNTFGPAFRAALAAAPEVKP